LSEKVSVYYLELHHPKDGKNRYKIDGQITVGSASSNNIYISDLDLAPRHCIFRVHQEILTIFQVAETGTSKIGSQALENSRMYILEKGDKVFLQDIKCIIRVEKEVVEEEDDEVEEIEEQSIDEDKTDEGFEVPNLDEDDIDEDLEEDAKVSFFSKLKSKLFKKKEIIVTDDEIEEEEEISKEEKMKDSIYIPKAVVDKEDKKPEKKKKKKEKIDRSSMPAFFARILAFICEIIIAFAFVSNVVPILELSSLYEQLFTDVSPFVTKGLDYISPYLEDKISLLSFINTFNFIAIFSTWLALNILSNLLLSVNYGLALIFVRTEGNFVTARIKGLIRFILSLVTLPFLIFDSPALIKKRTLKEVLTASELSYRHGLLKIFGNFIVLPIITIALVLLPAILEPELLDGPTVNQDLAIKEQKTEVALQTHPLRSLHVAISFDQNIKNDWAYSPFINGKKEKIISGMRFIRSVGERIDVVSIGPITKSLFPIELIKTIAKLDPFFKNKYPSLFENLDKPDFNKEKDSDAMSLFIDTLSLNQETLPRFISERGPTLTPYFELKKYLMNQLNIQNSNEVSTKLFGNKKVIVVYPTNIRSAMTLIYGAELVTMSISSRQGARPAMEKFSRAFLSNVSPLLDQASVDPDQANKWTAFDFFDYFNSKSPKPLTPVSQSALKNFMNMILLQRQNHAWSAETIESDYRKSMETLQEMIQADQDPWAKAIFDAMNVDQPLWQTPPSTVTPDAPNEAN